MCARNNTPVVPVAYVLPRDTTYPANRQPLLDEAYRRSQPLRSEQLAHSNHPPDGDGDGDGDGNAGGDDHGDGCRYLLIFSGIVISLCSGVYDSLTRYFSMFSENMENM